MIEHKGVKGPKALSEKYGIPISTIKARLKRGMSLEDALKESSYKMSLSHRAKIAKSMKGNDNGKGANRKPARKLQETCSHKPAYTNLQRLALGLPV